MDAGQGPRALGRSGGHRGVPGQKERFDIAMADFAEAYAAQNELDYAAIKQAAEDGRIEVAEVF